MKPRKLGGYVRYRPLSSGEHEKVAGQLLFIFGAVTLLYRSVEGHLGKQHYFFKRHAELQEALRQLRKLCHLEFCRGAMIGQRSPYEDFEQKLASGNISFPPELSERSEDAREEDPAFPSVDIPGL